MPDHFCGVSTTTSGTGPMTNDPQREARESMEFEHWWIPRFCNSDSGAKWAANMAWNEQQEKIDQEKARADELQKEVDMRTKCARENQHKWEQQLAKYENTMDQVLNTLCIHEHEKQSWQTRCINLLKEALADEKEDMNIQDTPFATMTGELTKLREENKRLRELVKVADEIFWYTDRCLTNTGEPIAPVDWMKRYELLRKQLKSQLPEGK